MAVRQLCEASNCSRSAPLGAHVQDSAEDREFEHLGFDEAAFEALESDFQKV